MISVFVKYKAGMFDDTWYFNTRIGSLGFMDDHSLDTDLKYLGYYDLSNQKIETGIHSIASAKIPGVAKYLVLFGLIFTRRDIGYINMTHSARLLSRSAISVA